MGASFNKSLAPAEPAAPPQVRADSAGVQPNSGFSQFLEKAASCSNAGSVGSAGAGSASRISWLQVG